MHFQIIRYRLNAVLCRGILIFYGHMLSNYGSYELTPWQKEEEPYNSHEE